ncbi:MAG TPA: PIN domain-containing protein [Candidatus Limnocylindria bacterium]|nr:PIN domain-containing protein [Candidatus Limnocylindria bacterium]
MIFVDTWAWVALAQKRDQHHRAAKAQHKRLQKARRRYVTTNFVLSELIAHLYTTLTPDQAQAFINTLLAVVDAGTYDLFHVSPDQFRRAWQMRQKYHDKPDISFVDFTSMVVMLDLGIADVFTGDDHFRQVNLGFRLVP